jgi:hypothetical protein
MQNYNSYHPMTPTNVEKRKDRDEAEERSPLQVESKRQKMTEIHRSASILGNIKDMIHQNQEQQRNETIVGANELASAFALASLASMSPSRNTNDDTNVQSNSSIMTEAGYESRDADNDASSELGDQNNNAVPISPDGRSPTRGGNAMSLQHHRRVTFSNDTKITSRQTSRRLSLPPRILTSAKSNSKSQPTTPRTNEESPRSIRFISHHQLSPRQQRSIQNPSWMRQHQQHNLMMQNQNLYHRNGPPSTLFLPPLQHPKTPSSTTDTTESNQRNKWICDFCNVASFETYEEACVHEESCRVRSHRFASHLPPPPPHHGRTNMSQHPPFWSPPSHSQHIHRTNLQQPYLSSPHHHHHPMVMAGGGSHIPPPPPPPISMRPNMAMDSPQSPWNVNRNTQQQRADTTEYKTISPNMSPRRSNNNNNIQRTISTQGSVEMTDTADESLSSRDNIDQQESGASSSHRLKDGDSIISLNDMDMVPPYVYFLMHHVEATHFTEADRFVARSKGPVGYSGFQCRHCHGHAGLGKYFPITAKSLSTNSTSQNIHSHLLKCRKVAPYIKDQLIVLKDEKSKSPRLEPGWRRIFFEKIWSRLHE